MFAWSAAQYLKFEGERTRPARDLLVQAAAALAPNQPGVIYDLGCGPGNSTELLCARFPDAKVIGVDSSATMLQEARQNLPEVAFEEADLATWTAKEPAELLFANAVYQWLPNHHLQFRRQLVTLKPGGVLAVQMPDNFKEPTHLLMRVTAARQTFAAKIEVAHPIRAALPPAAFYYDLLRPLAAKIDIWYTIYYHVLADAAAIVEWMMGTGLRPYLAPLSEAEKAVYLADYLDAIARAYPAQQDGQVLLRFPRLFIVAVRM